MEQKQVKSIRRYSVGTVRYGFSRRAGASSSSSSSSRESVSLIIVASGDADERGTYEEAGRWVGG